MFTHISQVPKRVSGIQYAFNKYLLNKLIGSNSCYCHRWNCLRTVRWEISQHLLYLDVKGRERGISERGLRMNSQRCSCILNRMVPLSHGKISQENQLSNIRDKIIVKKHILNWQSDQKRNTRKHVRNNYYSCKMESFSAYLYGNIISHSVTVYMTGFQIQRVQFIKLTFKNWFLTCLLPSIHISTIIISC